MQPQPVQTPIARDKRGRPVLPDILRAFDFRFALVSCMSGFIAMLYFFATFLMQTQAYPTANDYLFALAISLAAEVACFLYAMFLGKPEMWRQRSIRRFEKKGNKPYRYPAYWVAVSLAGILIVVVYVVLMVVLYAIIGAVTGMDALSIFIDGLFSMTAHVQIHPLTWVGVVLFFALAVLFFGIEFVRQSKYKKHFQKAYCGKAASAGGKKAVESQQILTAEVVLGTNSVNLVCEIVYEDGSFFKGVPASARLAYDETADEAGKEVEVEWNDLFGTLFTANATVVEA